MSCPDCFSGHVHDGTPQGQIIKLHGLDTYVAEPAGGAEAVRGIVVIIPDAFGWDFVNNRLLADNYAEKGNYRVYLPDFMKGHSAPDWLVETFRGLFSTGSLMAYLAKPYHIACALSAFLPFLYYNHPAKSWPVVEAFFKALRQNEAAHLPVGAAGFCWGGKHTVLLARGAEVDGKSLINAGFAGHPSLLEIPADIEKIKIPTSFALGEFDHTLQAPQIAQIKGVIDTNEDKGEVKVYLGVGHGFCVRADTKLVDSARQAAESEDQALEWLNRHFAGVSL